MTEENWSNAEHVWLALLLNLKWHVQSGVMAVMEACQAFGTAC